MCKWWNRGFCRERGACFYSHTKGDCQEHLKGGCTIKGCNTFRHRKKCRYFNTAVGCHRGESCEYLHEANINTKVSEVEERNQTVKEVQTKDINYMADKIVQTEFMKTCHCEIDSEKGEVLIKEDKIICVMKRAKCSDEERKDYEEKVQSEMEISEQKYHKKAYENISQ